MKTSELTEAALDWAVAKCEDVALVDGCIFTKNPDDEQVLYSPSTDWAQGGPIIEQERIAVDCERSSGHVTGWVACNEIASDENWDANVYYGPTPLVAAMRCYVASQLGDEVEIPEELK